MRELGRRRGVAAQSVGEGSRAEHEAEVSHLMGPDQLGDGCGMLKLRPAEATADDGNHFMAEWVH